MQTLSVPVPETSLQYLQDLSSARNKMTTFETFHPMSILTLNQELWHPCKTKPVPTFKFSHLAQHTLPYDRCDGLSNHFSETFYSRLPLVARYFLTSEAHQYFSYLQMLFSNVMSRTIVRFKR